MNTDSKLIRNPKASVDALLRKGASSGGQTTEPREAFDDARPRSREDIMLDVRFSDGHRCAFNYAYLIKLEYQPGDSLLLHFGTDQVRVEGRRLMTLYERLTEHRARFIQQGTEIEEDLKPEEAPHIDTIEITQRSEEE